jgi:transglutaminase-like putative cysteine protease
VTGDGTIASSESMGPGTIYTVVSYDTAATAAELQAATAPANQVGQAVGTTSLDADEVARYLQLPHGYPRVAALAASITQATGSADSTDPHTYDKVAAIEQWMATHVRYTTDIPPLAPGSDAVNSFLFGTRRGYCEQISTATVVMLRSLGIPAREAVGYVPGSYNPITDLYDVQAKDAHAWVQVWFPGYGWQNFDPTANVPLANPTPGSVLARSFGHALSKVPLVPLCLAIGAVVVVAWILRRRSRRPATWAHQVAADLARAGARIGSPRRTDETLSDYGRRLARAAPEHASGILAVSGLVERATYGGVQPSPDEIRWALGVGRRLRKIPKRESAHGRGSGRGSWSEGGGRGGGDGSGSDGPGPPGTSDPGQDLAWASASSNDAPAARSGR